MQLTAIGRLTCFRSDLSQKIFRVMKITAFFLFVACMQVSARGYSQITLSESNAPLPKVLKEIQNQSGYDIFYTYEMVQGAGNVTIHLKDATLKDALESCLSGTNLTYSILDKTVVIKAKTDELTTKSDFIPTPTLITGRVTDADGNPLAGATVTVKNGKNSVETNAEGFVSLNVSVGDVLVISYVGFEATEYKITAAVVASSDQQHSPGTGVSFTISLKRSTSELDEAQIIAYGQTTERLNVGDVSTVEGDDIKKQPISNPLAAIEGRVPGLFITQQSGMPGAAYSVKIRGQNSINNGNDPFYVIDGVPYPSELITNSNLNPGLGNPLDFINPSDIESITVLKDADATAIYGSRAANGAILIVTKKGKSGPMRLDVDASQGVINAPQRVTWLNTPQYLQMRNEAFQNDGVTPTAGSAPDLLAWDTARYTNWQKYLTGHTANYSNLSANISGGTGAVQYLFGANYHDETTVFPASYKDQKIALHFNLTSASADQRFKANISANYLDNVRTLPQFDVTTFANTAPDAPPLYNSDGSLNWANNIFANPQSYTFDKYLATTNNLVGNALLSYNLFRGFYIKSSFGYTNMQVNEKALTTIAAQDPAFSPTGSASFTDNNIHSWIIEPQLSYVRVVLGGRLEALAGSTFEENVTNGEEQMGLGYTSDALLGSILAAGNMYVSSLTSTTYKYKAVFGRVNYNYQERYLLNVNWRSDGSSRFGPDMQFHNFASVGAEWIFTQEPIFKRTKSVLSFGKLRGSYGTTGNDQIGDYTFYSLFQNTNYPYQGASALVPAGLYNPYVAWELTKKAEGGIELGFDKDRFLIQASYYTNRSSNQLIYSPLPSITGFGILPENLPATVANNGWEFTFNSTNIQSRHFKWKTSFNLTIARNKLVAFPDLATNPYYEYAYQVGKPITGISIFHCVGVDPQSGVYQFSDSSGKTTFDPNFLTDRTAFVNLAPKYYGGLSNSFSYKEWQLDVMVQFRKQVGQNPLFAPFIPPGLFTNNNLEGVMSRWRNPGDNAPIEKFTSTFGSPAANAYSYAQQSDKNYTDASFVRFSNVTLSYTLSPGAARTIGMSSLQVYIHAQNLWTITGYKGMDPETQSLTVLPTMRVLVAGVRLSL